MNTKLKRHYEAVLFSGLLAAQWSTASTIEAVNHTHWAINRFSVDGRQGIDIIGAYQGGGGRVALCFLSSGTRE